MSPHADIGVNPRKTSEYLEVIDNSVSLGNLAFSVGGELKKEGLFGIP